MIDREPVHDVHELSSPRRDFLRNAILLALPVAATAMPAMAAVSMSSPLPSLQVSSYAPPERARGSAQNDVRNHGAVGNGSHDDTTAFQNAIDALPSDGGTVVVPAGTYLIDPTRRVRLRSRMHLRLDPGAVLKAKANAAERAYVLMLLKVSDVVISGGEIVGDRDRHLATTGQWGHGIMVRGSSRVTIRDILIRKCWGDGISIGASTDTPQVVGSDIALSNVACIDNRRQGMSIGQARNVKVYDSEFSYTGGIFPGCGIDIESDFTNPGASGTHIENCLIRNNQGNGIQAYKRSTGTTIKRNVIENNSGYGILAMGSVGGFIALNRIRNNALIGVGIRAQSGNYALSQNHFYNNARQFRSYDLPKLAPPLTRSGNFSARHTEVVNSPDIRINSNFYYDD